MSCTNRQVSNAVGLVIAGAMRDVDNGADLTSADVYSAVARELRNWLESDPALGQTIAAEYFADFMVDPPPVAA